MKMFFIVSCPNFVKIIIFGGGKDLVLVGLDALELIIES